MKDTPKKPAIQFLDTPEERYAVIPLSIIREVETLEDLEDEILAAQLLTERDERESTIPAEIVERELSGVHPVRAWRDYRGLTQEELARRASTSKAYVSQIETGRRSPGLALARALARALDAPLDVLLEQLADYEEGSGSRTTSADVVA
jgi:DNA-binding XRE family transcriptional regulator